MSNKNIQSNRTKRSKSLLQQHVARRQRRVLSELLENRLLFSSAIGLTVGNDTVTNTATGVSGSVNILFNVPAGVSESLAGYQTEVDLTPTITGVSLTAAAPSNYIFTGQTPTNNSNAANPDALDVYDFLPNAGESDPITDGAGLEQVNFQIPAGISGMYTLTLNPTTTILSDPNGNAIPLGTLNAGTITINPAGGVTNVAPTVTTNPQSQTLTSPADASFTAAASGTPTPTVQWFVENAGSNSFSAVPGATSTTLDLGASTVTESGNEYEAVFTNSAGSATTSAATLTVDPQVVVAPVAPVVATNPTSLSLTAPADASFTASASGTPTPTVQWLVEDAGTSSFTAVPGATSTTLDLGASTTTESGNQYEAVFTNSAGSATTNAATLTVNSASTAPVITTNPTSLTLTAPADASFTASASGTPTPTVQWLVEDAGTSSFTAVPGATSTILDLGASTTTESGNQYEAVFTNSGGSATTTAATLTVNNPVSSSLGLTVNNVTVTNTATGVSGSTTVVFDVPAGLADQISGYNAEVDLTPVISGVSLSASAPATGYIFAGLTSGPTAIPNGNPDELATYDYLSGAGQSVPINNGEALEQVNFQIPAGITGMYTLSLSNVVLADINGNAIPLGTLTAGTLTINGPGGTTPVSPTVITNPTSLSLIAPADASFTAAASGTPTPTVQWFVEDSGSSSFAVVPGATSTTLDLGASSTTESGNEYEAVFTNSAGSVTTTAATLTVTSATATPVAPVVTLNPVSQTLTAPADASFTAAATGTPTPTVQWLVETAGSSTFTNIPGATSVTLNLGASATTQSGNEYEAVFTNSLGTATTTAATLTVNSSTVTPLNVVVTLNPTSQSLTVGQVASFSAAATGTPTPTVQWFVELAGGSSFSAVPGATGTTLDLGGATLGESGNEYEAVFTNSTGSATTTAATLTVNPATTGGGLLTGVGTTAASSYNLTQLGTTDWATWGVGGAYGTYVHKATGGSLISNVTPIGTGGFGAFTDHTRNLSWTDGTPVASDPDDSGYDWANNGIGAGYSFTVPATTTPQTLYVYLGGFSAGSTITAHLSDSSATDFTESFSSSGHYNDLVAITFDAAHAGQTLTITYVKSQNIGGTNGSADLIAAWLGGQLAGPTILTNPTSVSAASGSPVTFTASASGTPTPSVQWQVSVAGGAFTNIAGATSTTYSFTANTGENGNQYQAVFTNPNGSVTTSAATLTVAAQAGVLTGVNSTAASSYNLTSLGTQDWIHWGVGGNPGTVDRKANVAPEISNVTKIGTGNFGGYVDPTRNVSWTDGTPTPSLADDSGYIWANNGIGAGYSFTAPADLTTRTIYVYLGGFSAGSTLTAHLSGTSVPDYVLNLSSSGHYNDIVAITYQASTPGQTLTLSYVKSSNVNGTNGSADLIAAWM